MSLDPVDADAEEVFIEPTSPDTDDPAEIAEEILTARLRAQFGFRVLCPDTEGDAPIIVVQDGSQESVLQIHANDDTVQYPTLPDADCPKAVYNADVDTERGAIQAEELVLLDDDGYPNGEARSVSWLLEMTHDDTHAPCP